MVFREEEQCVWCVGGCLYASGENRAKSTAGTCLHTHPHRALHSRSVWCRLPRMQSSQGEHRKVLQGKETQLSAWRDCQMFLNRGLVYSWWERRVELLSHSQLSSVLGYLVTELLEFGSWMFSKGPRAEDLDPDSVLLVGGGNFRWCI